MYSNLVKADYEIKDMNLKELRELLVKQNNLTPLDILKGFHEESEFNLKYSSCVTNENLKDIKLIQEEYKSYLLNKGKEILQKIYDEKFNSILVEYQKENADFTVENITRYINDKHDKDLSVYLCNDIFRFLRELSNMSYNLKSDIEEYAKEYMTSWIKEKFNDRYKINDYHSSEFEGLPWSLNINKEINIDFSKVYELVETEYNKWNDSNLSFIEYNPHIKSDKIHTEVKFYGYDMIEISVHLEESKAKEIFDKAINSVIYHNNSIGELEYLQNLESQPITLNFDTKSKKYQLIDGYKRLLYITDENLLKYSAPIKIFTDLNDVQFLSLLYASNVWKNKNNFHDRGFLFALKTRFGFEIPSFIYQNQNIYENELSILQLYDFGGNLITVHKDRLMNTLDTHEHLVSDINMMYNFLVNESKNYKYDENICDEIKYTIIELVGELRRQKNNFNKQNELSKELIVSIFEDEFINKLCAKKHLSTRTYVINYFRDKGIYNRIRDMIKDNLVIIEN